MDEQRRDEIKRRIEATGRKLGRAMAKGSHRCEEFATAFECSRPLPKVSAEFLASARRVVLPSAEIIYRASVGSSTARAVIGLLTHRAKFTRN